MSNADVAKAFYERIGAGDVDAAVALHTAGGSFTAPDGEHPVPDGLRQMLNGYVTAFPGFKVDISRAIEAGDDVALEGVWSGTNTGPMSLPDGSSMPATGKTVKAPFAGIFTVRDGKIAAHHEYWDMAGFMRQLQ